MSYGERRKLVGLMLVLACLSPVAATIVSACDVPVFRYALERWDPRRSPYNVVIFGRGAMYQGVMEQGAIYAGKTDRSAMDPESRKRLDRLEEVVGDADHPVNIRIEMIDLDENNEAVSALKLDETKLPWVRVEYPYWKHISEPVWQGPLASLDVNNLVDSPVRRRIVGEIISGQSAVWVLIESGNQQKDDQAEAVLTEQLKVMEQQLELPEGMEEAAEFEPDTEVQLKIAFSLIRIDPKDPAEKFFVAMLRHTESDLVEFDEPIAMPIYGRGRAHLAHVGLGINADTIATTSQFLVGACSCVVADQNPGVDMVFATDWDGWIAGTVIAETPMPELPGLSVDVDVDEVSTSSAVFSDSSGVPPGSDPGLSNSAEAPTLPLPQPVVVEAGNHFLAITIGVLGLAVLVVCAWSLILVSRRGEGTV